jgi:hypothetical protein
MAGRLEFRILGPLSVQIDETEVPAGGPKQRALLALLLLSANRVVSRDRLVAELFPEQSVNAADHALRNHISRLRKVLAPATEEPRLVARPPGYSCGSSQTARHQLFEELIASAREGLRPATPGRGGLSVAARGCGAAVRLPISNRAVRPRRGGAARGLRLGAVELRVDAQLALARHALVPEPRRSSRRTPTASGSGRS